MEGYDLHFASVSRSYQKDVPDYSYSLIRDASRWNKLGIIVLAFQVGYIVSKVRPHFVISTGAAPGVFALAFGKLFRARTIWVDSVANADQLSLSGKLAGKFADLWLTQWPHLEAVRGPRFSGSVL